MPSKFFIFKTIFSTHVDGHRYDTYFDQDIGSAVSFRFCMEYLRRFLYTWILGNMNLKDYENVSGYCIVKP